MYPSIVFPADTPVAVEMTAKHAKRYLEWFRTVLPERIALLESEVRKDVVGSDWKADFTPGSLRQLGAWFVTKVATEVCEPVPVILHERQIASIDYKLTGETYIRSFDAGIYFGEILIRADPRLKWDVITKGTKRNIDFGHIVIYDYLRVRR